jgi:hypothetical protein
LSIFPAANERSALENLNQSQRREFLRGFQLAFSNIVINFKEANKNLKIIVFGVKSVRKALKTISANTDSTNSNV